MPRARYRAAPCVCASCLLPWTPPDGTATRACRCARIFGLANRVRLNATAPPAYPERDRAVACGAAHVHLTAYLPPARAPSRRAVRPGDPAHKLVPI
jgi:hypothetical protein